MSATKKVSLERFKYDDQIVKLFILASMIFGVVALLVGVVVAFQLATYKANFALEWISFGRLRPLHTNAAIFAFVGNAVFAGIYHSTQRLCKARLFSDLLSRIHFWGWQLIIVSAAVTLPLGLSSGKEYAELEWPIDIAIALIWVIFSVNLVGTLLRRREKHIYVAIWFYIATFVTVAVLHIVNSLSLPVSFMQSYSLFAGVQDALVQWWYGHNAVAFFLTTPFLGLMYYYVPKAINRPIYSYRLSIIHFWSLVFLYIWAGPHHLLYSTLPEWSQTLGMIFSLMIWAPSWGGMINGLLTMRGAWDRVRREPVLKFFATAVTFYGMSTFEGPLLSIKSVNGLAHFTDWIVGHVHSGTVGWNYMMIAGMFYYLVPKLYGTKLYSIKLAGIHFWTATVGLLLYIVSMWTAGITQGLMWRAVDASGKLIYPDFVETVMNIMPMYWVRAFGGVLIFSSILIMAYNLYMTARQGSVTAEEEHKAPALSAITGSSDRGHRKLEGLPMAMTVFALLAILVGSLVEILPAIMANNFIVANPKVTPYTSLEQAGRDIYIREGCYTCHSQMVRPMVDEKLRYGRPSEASESVYDHPFQWGSRRIGPDLARVGKKYPDMWHYRHMLDPREVTPKSIMPSYGWLFERKINFKILRNKLKTLSALGVPYSEHEIANADQSAREQAQIIAKSLAPSGVPATVANREITALIAYLQKLGSDLGPGE
ncbi:MAG: cytochrome-c oxidase, cbb3-type subunit I [Bdellovibrionales bacterium]|nr:cytochrome-c oxidase, cbb3-type subunit I [Bdellovibrionales bacterium]MBT3526517.1 cytochrome-c oxidase, cbb3-type subunit I [Bdellovibrionales bacterium]